MPLLTTKTCSKCKVDQEIGQFTCDNSRTDGLYPWCKTCKKEAQKQYRDNGTGAKYSREYRARERAEALAHYGAICVCCDTTFEPHLTLDHVNGGGHKERQKRAGIPTWRIAKEEGYPNRFQVMCFNCNWAKHHEGKCQCQEIQV